MDLERRIDLIKAPPTEEIITEKELVELLQTKDKPIAYNGFEPSGIAHLGTGLVCGIKIQDFIDAGIHYKIFLATWHAAINNKLEGNLYNIRKAANYFKHVWTALGIDTKKVEYIFAEDLAKDLDYWELVLKIGSRLTTQRILRALPIMGRKRNESLPASGYIYPLMQVSDIFKMQVDICQLGMDQRRANILAREVGPSLGLWKPVAVHHHLLIGLQGPEKMGGYEDKRDLDLEISSKMSKSIPKTFISMHDSPKDIKEKINQAFCPPKVVEMNPILEICKFIIFRKSKSLLVERPKKFGGNLEFFSYQELEKSFREGNLHPADLKNAVAEELIKILEPVRKYFEKNNEAKELLKFMQSMKITR